MSYIERNLTHGERTPTNPSLSVIYGLARALGVPPKLLLPDVDDIPTSTTSEVRSAQSRVEQQLADALAKIDGG